MLKSDYYEGPLKISTFRCIDRGKSPLGTKITVECFRFSTCCVKLSGTEVMGQLQAGLQLFPFSCKLTFFLINCNLSFSISAL